MRAAVYTRLSLDREGETSTERQEADCRAYAAARGWQVVTVYKDRLSGYKDVRRPGYEAFMRDLASGAVDVGVIWKLDRLTRKGVKDIAPLLSALERGKTSLASVNDAIDTSTAMGEGVLALLASIAKQESQNTSLRTRSAKALQARNGAPVMGGNRPFGYEQDRVTVRESEAVLLREAAGRVVAGESVLSVCTGLERRGVVMAPSTLRRTLLSPRVRGYRAHGGALYPAQWPALLDEETAAAVEAALGPGRPDRRSVRTYMLTGVAFCGLCRRPLRGQTGAASQGGRRRYACVRQPGSPGCGRIRASAVQVEKWAETVVLAALEARDLVVGGSEGAETGALLAECGEVRGRLVVLEEAFYVAGSLPEGRFLALRASLEARLADLEGRIAAAEGAGTLSRVPAPVDVGAAWAAWSLEERRTVVRALFPRLEVAAAAGRGVRFSPGRLRFVDRAGLGWRLVSGEEWWECRPEAGGDLRVLRLSGGAG